MILCGKLGGFRGRVGDPKRDDRERSKNSLFRVSSDALPVLFFSMTWACSACTFENENMMRVLVKYVTIEII